MSKILREYVKKIQFERDWTVEEVAKSIGYSRVHLSKEMKKEKPSDLERLLFEKHKDILQNDSIVSQNDNWLPEKNEREIERIMFKLLLDDYLRLKAKVTGVAFEDLQEDFRRNTNLTLDLLKEERVKRGQ